jgi:hypothetical protein
MLWLAFFHVMLKKGVISWLLRSRLVTYILNNKAQSLNWLLRAYIWKNVYRYMEWSKNHVFCL